MLIPIACLVLLLLGIALIRTTIKLGKKWQTGQPKQRRSNPPADWHTSPHRSRKQKHKVYVAPVMKRKWRTPRRSSH